MNQKRPLALVPQSARDLLSLGAGAKSVLSSMVEETFAPARRKHSKTLKIVIVDEYEGSRTYYKLLISDWCKNVTILSFENPFDAMEELYFGEEPHLLITDILLNHMDGIGLIASLAKLRDCARRRIEYPIFVISAFWTQGIEARIKDFTRAHLNVTYLPKPIDIPTFRNALERQLNILRKKQE